MTQEQLIERKKALEAEQRKIEAQFNYLNGQIAGQLTLINELLQEQP